MSELAEAHSPLSIGTRVCVDAKHYTITRFVDLYSVLAVTDDGERIRLSVSSILDSLSPKTVAAADHEVVESSGFESLSPEAWVVAEKRASILAPIIGAERPTREMAISAAAELGVHVATIYRWVNALKSRGMIADLAPRAPQGGRGKFRTDPLAEAIVSELIDEKYLTTQRPRVGRLMRDIEMRCRRAGITPPHPNTVRRRIAALSERKVTERRYGRKAADDQFAARPGQFPGADWPNAVWQIDHTPIDVLVVDDVHRRHIGRPWLTVAIDVYSRCIAGFYLSLDPPSEVSVGMCLVHAILLKEGWLAAIGVSNQWPLYGFPATVHADNGKEFHGAMVSRAAEQYRFRMEWRKVKTPNWGGHIERMMGNFNEEVHALPGTTFSNTVARGAYLPHEEAALTFSELELYLAEYICGAYHQRVHQSIGRPPIRRYEAGILGDGIVPGRGLPRPPADPKRLRLDFMPLLERTVQPTGIRIDGVTYYDPVLEPWIRRNDAQTQRHRKFTVRRDPRDISVIYFLDPDTGHYYPIPYRNLTHPSISLWELREVRNQLKKEGRAEVDEDMVFETYERLSRLVERASENTVKARKSAQKKRGRKQTETQESAQSGGSSKTAREPIAQDDWDQAEAVPFGVLKVK
jgi:putative transposase